MAIVLKIGAFTNKQILTLVVFYPPLLSSIFSHATKLVGGMMRIVAGPLLAILLLLTGCGRKEAEDSSSSPDTQGLTDRITEKGVDESKLEAGPARRELDSYLERLEPGREGRDSEFLFLASTLGTPRIITSQLPNMQGEGKIVRFRFEKDRIKVYQVDEDDRFTGNPLNERPVLSLPVRYQCATTADGRENCTQKQVSNPGEEWRQKRYFVPDFNQVSLTHLSELKIFMGDHCFYPTSQRALNAEFTHDVLNIELEREFKLKRDMGCITQNFDFKSFSVKSPSFKVRYFYSIVRLNKLVSKDYRPVEYPVQEHLRFGFFKDRVETLGDNFDPNRPREIYYLNRFNPGRDAPRKVDFHLSASFNRPENLYLRDATHETVRRVNNALERAEANIRLNLVQAESKKKEKHSGDLRYNTIVLIDEPLALGLLGYGPSVSNPRTGEILQAHSNMYSGVLKSIVREVYQTMVRASAKKFQKKKKEEQEDDATSFPRFPQIPNPSAFTAARIKWNQEGPDTRDIAQKYQRIKRALDLQMAPQLAHHHQEKIKLSRQGVSNESLHEDEHSSPMDYQSFMELHSKNNAYHVDMVHKGNLGRELAPEITEIPDILIEGEQLKPWEELNREQRAQISKVITTGLYIAILTHELGHNLGLRHNFMGSTDSENSYTDEEAQALGMRTTPPSSSLMDYLADDLYSLSVFGKYDVAALRYAYKREVELAESGEMVKIPTTLTALQSQLAQEKKGIKSYRFCSDGHTGSALCNRFDTGFNLTEIATFYAENYWENYQERNWRNGRLNFSSFQLPGYIFRNMRSFRSMREMYEIYEIYETILGPTLMLHGCSTELLALFPQVCTNINDVRKAAILAGGFFLRILKTPDLTCALDLPKGRRIKPNVLSPCGNSTMQWTGKGHRTVLSRFPNLASGRRYKGICPP